MAKQLPEQTQHLAKSLPGVFRFSENPPDWMTANVCGVDDEHGHQAVERCRLRLIAGLERRAR
jgi:hypothetical protein